MVATANCAGYDYSVPIEVCVQGPVGGGATARVDVYVHGQSGNSTTQYLTTAPKNIGHVSNWDGSAHTFSGWADSPVADCTVTSSQLTIQVVGTNQVRVTLSFTLDNCGLYSYQYEFCGNSPGPFTFTDEFLVPLTLNGACNHGA